MFPAASLGIVRPNLWVPNPKYMSRSLVRSQPLSHPLIDLVRPRSARVFSQPQETANHFSIFGVLETHDAGFGDGFVFQQPFLDLNGGDILAAYW